MRILLCFLFSGIIFCAHTQPISNGKSFRIYSEHAMFPDSLRNKEPRVYNGKTYSANDHYNDSSAYVFVPDYFDKNKQIQFVIWFHGWANNIDSALTQYKLQEQFYAAHLNAIFLFPEGPKNAPDSYGGKFEKADTFNYFMKDVVDFLTKQQCIKKNSTFDIICGGHSGAYRVMSYLLLHSKYNFKGILLFDALYGEQEKFAMYLEQHRLCKMIDIYTDHGGTLDNSLNFASSAKAWHWKYVTKEEDDFLKEDVKLNKIVFLHSKMQHNDVVNNNNNFQRFLEALK